VALDSGQGAHRRARAVAKAHRLGVPLEEYAIRLLAQGARVAKQPRSGSELVGYWKNDDLIGYRPEIRDSSLHARRLRDEAKTRGAR
jgi:hypothetical protein